MGTEEEDTGNSEYERWIVIGTAIGIVIVTAEEVVRRGIKRCRRDNREEEQDNEATQVTLELTLTKEEATEIASDIPRTP